MMLFTTRNNQLVEQVVCPVQQPRASNAVLLPVGTN